MCPFGKCIGLLENLEKFHLKRIFILGLEGERIARYLSRFLKK